MKRSNAYWLMAVLILFVAIVESPAAVIRGVVKDSVSSAVLSGVAVQVKGTTNQTTTDAQGRFSLTFTTGIIGQEAGTVPPQLFSCNPEFRTIFWNNGQRAAVRLYAVNGNLVMAQTGGTRSVLPELCDGMYLLDMSVDGQRMLGKIMVAGQAVNFGSLVSAQTGLTAKAAANPTVTMEAESMTMSGYIVDAGNAGLAMVNPNGAGTGTATKTFSGTSGTYNVTITIVPENDGQPNVKLYVGTTKILDQTYPVDAAYYTLNTKLDYTAGAVQVNNGAVIKIEGAGDSLAWARVDKITFSDASNVTLVCSKSGYISRELTVTLGDTNVSVGLTALAGGWPDASNTGPTGTLTASGDLTVTTSGALIQNLNVSGSITVRANNVTIRNCNVSGSVTLFENNTGLVVEDCILGWIGVSNFTLRRCEMSSQSDDLIRISGPNVTIEDCYLHVDGPEIAGTHCDIIQEYPVGTGANCIVRHNTLYIAMTQNSCVFSCTDVLVENNLLAGAGYTLYVNSGYRVINNHFSTKYYPNCGYWGVRTGTAGQWTGNVWHETGLPCN